MQLIETLRGPNGCPWDKEQTPQSLRKFLVEEAYEALHAIDEEDWDELAGELGDVLLQIGLHAQIGKENGRFDIDDVCRKINEKLIRRHPHVFGDREVSGSDEVVRNWQQIKDEERGKTQDHSALDNTTPSLPALMYAMEVSRKAARAGFEWPDVEGVFDKMHEEIDELKTAIAEGKTQNVEDELGDLLFTIVNIGRWVKVEPEEALRKMVKRFITRYRAMEDQARQDGMSTASLSAEQWDSYWNNAKAKISERA